MIRFSNWFESENRDSEIELKRIWDDTFKALGVDGNGSDADKIVLSLSNVEFDRRSSGSPYKGRIAVMKRLDDGQIFDRLNKLNDPKVSQQVANTQQWINSDSSSNGSTTIGTLMQKLFGDNFDRLIDSKLPSMEKTLEKPDPQNPEPNSSTDMANLQQKAPQMPPDQQSPQMPNLQ